MDASTTAVIGIVTVIIQFLGGIIVAGIAWYMKKIISDMSELTKRLTNFEISAPKEYVLKPEYKETMGDIKNMFDKLFVKLDLKQDKHERSRYDG